MNPRLALRTTTPGTGTCTCIIYTYMCIHVHVGRQTFLVSGFQFKPKSPRLCLSLPPSLSPSFSLSPSLPLSLPHTRFVSSLALSIPVQATLYNIADPEDVVIQVKFPDSRKLLFPPKSAEFRPTGIHQSRLDTSVIISHGLWTGIYMYMYIRTICIYMFTTHTYTVFSSVM